MALWAGMYAASDSLGILPGHPADLAVDYDGVPAVGGGGYIGVGAAGPHRGDAGIAVSYTHLDVYKRQGCGRGHWH